MSSVEKLMEDACSRFLTTREQWLANIDSEIVQEQYTSAKNYLYAAFAFEWSADEKFLQEAFSQFRKAVVRRGDGRAA